MRKTVLITNLLAIFSVLCISFSNEQTGNRLKEESSVKETWADSVLKTLSLEEKIAQLIIIRAHSDKTADYNASLLEQIKKYKVGGLCFFQGGPVRQAHLTNRAQAVSSIPLLISIDGEWGLGMRLDSVLFFPRQMALGAGNDLENIYAMGAQIAKQCKRMGIHVNFVPCVDVNNNPNNPVINSRSFGADPQLVAKCGVAYLKGLQQQGVLGTGKHFPGHGDTEIDSHKKLPTISHTKQHLKQVELYPFKELIAAGLDGMMIGHLNVPALDDAPNALATCSYKIVTELLQNEMGFKGLIFTDGLEMGGITNQFPNGELEVRALMAGCDILLLPPDIETAMDFIKTAIRKGRLTRADIDKKCLKMLKMKEKYVLPNTKTIDTKNLIRDLNSAEAKEINTKLTQKSLTLLQNNDNVIPLINHSDSKIVHLRVDKSGKSTLETTMKKYIDMQTFVSKTGFANETSKLFESVYDADYVIVSMHDLTQVPRNQYNIEKETLLFLDSLTKSKQVILVLMGNPYVLEYMPFSGRFSAILVGYHPLETAEKCVAEALCGLAPITGKLPVELSNYPLGSGIQTPKMFANKSLTEINAFYQKMDSVILNGISQKAYPGCRVLVAKKDTILYNKSFGTFSYADSFPVNQKTIYDLASVTKIMATTLSMMKLYDEKKINLEEKLSHYLPYLHHTNKETITIEQVMTHTAGLSSWIPFYEKTLQGANKTLNPAIYSKTYSNDFSVQVCADLYIKSGYRDSIYHRICKSELRKDTKYLYSDLGFYLLADLVKAVSGKPLDVYLEENLYAPLHLTHTLFNPLNLYGLNDIPPTEKDTVFRKTLVQGYVHDQGAAMLGCVSGHAGLFSTAGDLYKLAQLLLHKGNYKGKSYFSKETVETFTAYRFEQGDCRRGLGFDKPSRTGANPCSKYASPSSYGHSGFTGTFVWIDPQYDLVYIFLSNRVHPDAGNTKITELGVRTVVQDVVYQYVK